MVKGRRLGALFLAGVLAAGLAACGDDDDGDETGLEDIGDDGDDGSSDTTIDLGDISGLPAECEVLVQAALAFGAAFGGGDSDFGDLAEQLDEFVDDVPDEIEGDVRVIAEAYREFAENFGDLDFNDPEALSDPELQAQLAEAVEIFSRPDVLEASENLTVFQEANCEAGD